LLQFGRVDISDPEPTLTLEKDFLGREYFTSGERLVLWVTDNPVSTHDVTIVDWEHLKNDR
jgi:hypothetical protein